VVVLAVGDYTNGGGKSNRIGEILELVTTPQLVDPLIGADFPMTELPKAFSEDVWFNDLCLKVLGIAVELIQC
jgi:hypothetical protein